MRHALTFQLAIFGALLLHGTMYAQFRFAASLKKPIIPM